MLNCIFNILHPSISATAYPASIELFSQCGQGISFRAVKIEKAQI